MLGLRRNEDVRTLVFTSTFFILLLILWNFHHVMAPRVKMLLWAAECYFSFIGAVAVHNIIHCPMFKKSLPNKILQSVLTITYGHPVCNYVPGHNLSHHQHTQTARDVMRTTKLRFRWHFLNGLLFFVIIGIAMLGNDKNYFDVQRAKKRPIYKQMKIESLVLVAFYGIAIATDFSKFVVLILIPHSFAKFCIITLNMLQHDGCDPDSDYNHSRNFTSPILNFFAYNNGYHSIHHMDPGMHWADAKIKHDKLVKPFMHPNLDQYSMLLYIFKTFIFPGIRIDYLGKPYHPPSEVPDEPWFYDSSETFST